MKRAVGKREIGVPGSSERCASNEIRQLWCYGDLISYFDMNFLAPHRKTMGIRPPFA